MKYLRKRGNKFYVDNSGERIVVEYKGIISMKFSNKELFTDYHGTIYNGWQYIDGKRFYTFATEQECKLFNSVLEAIPGN